MVHFHMPLVDKLVERHRERRALRKEQKALRQSTGERRSLFDRLHLTHEHRHRQRHTEHEPERDQRRRQQRRSRRDSSHRVRRSSVRSHAAPTQTPKPAPKHSDKQGEYHYARRTPEQKLGFSFSGGGWLMVYMYGVAKALREHGLHEDARFIGTSAGCLSIIAMVGESDFDAILETIVTSYVPRAHGSLQGPFQMREYLVDAITRHTNLDNLHKLNDKCTVVYTSLSSWEARKVSQFRDFNHLLWTMVASCCATPLVGLPFWHEGELVVDGGIMENQPEFPDVLAADEENDKEEDSDSEDEGMKRPAKPAAKPLKTVTVSPNIYSGADIRPSRYVPAWWSMYPPSERDMRWLYELGYEDTLRWIVREEVVPDADQIEIPTRGASYDGEWKTVIGQVVGYRWVEDQALAAVALLDLSTKTTASTFLRVEMIIWKFLAVLAASVDRVAIIWTALASITLFALILLDQHHTLEFALVAASHLGVAIMKVGSAYHQVDNSEQWRTLQASVMALAKPSTTDRESVYDATMASYGRPSSASTVLTPEQHEALVESSYIYRMSSSFV